MNLSIHKRRTETVHLLVLCALPKEVEHLAPPFVRGAARRRTSLFCRAAQGRPEG